MDMDMDMDMEQASGCEPDACFLNVYCGLAPGGTLSHLP